MLKKRERLLNQLAHYSIVFLLLSCSKYQGNLTVIKAYAPENGYAPCPLSNKGIQLNIKNIWKYKKGKLIQSQGCLSEGLYTEDFEKNNQYSNEEEKIKNLSISKSENSINFFNQKYTIVRNSKDSIFVKSGEDEYLIFVGDIK
ncbi:MAG: hypothetical protein MUW56_13160 [Chryseobacterium sp.]|uniref:hypothetical protein n=1 Tax=Chryseobacterium sp. TaxID=1871047 RepID=UPI0025C3A866|nr:hypothetical protein [Chryseobacterium sp.]MCJ7934543.1 hypothetical protein [Chryseobacterium sp.]